MGVYIGKQRVGVALAGVKPENLDAELDYQEAQLKILDARVNGLPVHESIIEDLAEQTVIIEDIENQVDSLKDISDETLGITENGEYDVIDYGKVVVMVSGADVKEIEVTLPEAFEVAKSTSSLVVNDNTILFSSDEDGVGVWMHTISDDSWRQIYSNGFGLDYAQRVSDTKWLICSNSTSGILLYNANDNSITKIYTETGWPWVHFHQVSDTKWFISMYEGAILKNTGILCYDASNDTITKIYTSGLAWKYFNQVTETKWLIGGDASGAKGILLYDTTNDTLTQIYTDQYQWKYFNQVTETKWLIGSGTGTSIISPAGIVLYDSSNDTITKVSSSGGAWTYFHKVNNNTWLISSTATTGILLYDVPTNTFTKPYTTGKSWAYAHIISDTECLLSGSDTSNEDSQGLLYCDISTNTFTFIATYRYAWKYFYKASDTKCLIGNVTAPGIWVYDVIDKTFTQIYESGLGYDTFVNDDGNCYVEGSDKTLAPATLYYNSTDNSLKPVKYYLGKVR